MRDLLIGLDIGTSAVKAGLFDLQGRPLAVSRQPLSIHVPHPGWAEQKPQDWWRGALFCLAEILTGVDADRVAAVGLCGQCPGHVLVDKDGGELGMAIIWRDRRAKDEARLIGEMITSEQSDRWTGSAILADVSLPPARLLWLKKHRSKDWSKTRVILQPKDYVGAKLTGEMFSDIHSAHCLLNPQTGSYDPDYFNALGLPLEIMPRTVSAATMIGGVTREAAELTGLRKGTPVAAGTIDAWCDALGTGGILPGVAADMAGTSEIVTLGTDREVNAEGVFLASIGADAHFLCGPMSTGGGLLHWLVNGFYPEIAGGSSFATLEAAAASVSPGGSGLVFLPYLGGERAPVWDPLARGAFVGLTHSHDRRHLTRAVYEGVAFAIRHVLEVCEAAVGNKTDQLRCCGGGSRSALWNQIKANVLQREVIPTLVAETASLGAAMLAGISAGLYENVHDACDQTVRFGVPVEPDVGLADLFDHNYGVYRQLYPALHRIEELTLENLVRR